MKFINCWICSLTEDVDLSLAAGQVFQKKLLIYHNTVIQL